MSSAELDPQREGGDSSTLEGILSIRQSSFPADFETTGNGEKRLLCGTFHTFSCLETELHDGLNIPEGIAYQQNLSGNSSSFGAYHERRKYSCKRQACPLDWKDWASRQTSRAARRLMAFKLKGRNLKPIHVVVSIPNSDYGLGIVEMRKKVYRALKSVHLLGGMCIYHPKRWKDGVAYYSPHFHIIGYGWLTDVRKNYIASGYVVRNLRIRKTVEGTIWYQLSHAGYHEKRHTVTWFGCLSYNRLHLPKEDETGKEHRCPLCKNVLRLVIWVGEGSHGLPDEDGYCCYGPADGWIYAAGAQKLSGEYG